MKNNAIVTLTSQDFVVGTMVMFYSLLKNSNLDNFTFDVIYYRNDLDLCQTREKLEFIKNKFNKNCDIVFTESNIEEYGNLDNTLEKYKKTMSKFLVFSLPYEKIVFLDSDLIILGDLTELFNIKEDFSACHDSGTPTEFNTGVMVVNKNFINKNIIPTLIDYAKNFFSHRGDQEHINRLVGKNYNKLPAKYNILKTQHRHNGSWLADARILHYIAQKPWEPYDNSKHYPGNLECTNIEKLWINLYNEIDSEIYQFIETRKNLIDYINKLYPGGFGAEIGVQRGEFSKDILDRWNCEKLYLIDPWVNYENYQNDNSAVSNSDHEDNFLLTKENTKSHKDRVEIIRDFSVQASKEFYEESLDFVYLDGRHDAEGVAEDIEHWYPIVKKGGILAGHDYLNEMNEFGLFEVKKVVNNNFVHVNYTMKEKFPSWWIKKT